MGANHGGVHAALFWQVFEATDVLRWRVHGIVGRVVSEKEKERLRAGAADKLLCLGGKPFGEVLAILKNFGAAAIEIVEVDAAWFAPIIAVRVEVDASRMETIKSIKTVIKRTMRVRRAEMPLAHKPGRVPIRLQQRCDRLLARRQFRAVGRNAGADRMPSGHQSSSGRRAHGGIGVPVLKEQSVFGKCVDIRVLISVEP